MTKRPIRKEAVSLLRVSKAAFKFIRDNPSGPDQERETLLEELRAVIDRADPPVFDEDLVMLVVTMTHKTADAVESVLIERADLSALDQEVLDAFIRGHARKQKRAYLRLDLDPRILRRLQYALMHSERPYQDRPFKRLAREIEEQAAAKNPMLILGQMGL